MLVDIHSKVRTALQGEHPSHYTGLGVEYESVREYRFGDDYRRIDWSITARTPPKPGEDQPLFMKEYREEKNLNVLLILDQSGSMEYKRKVLTAVKAALVIADLAQRRGDHMGLVCFRQNIELFLPPKRSSEQAYRILRTLCQSYRTGQASNLRTMAVEVVRTLQRRSIINLISDINHEVSDYVYFARLAWTRGHVVNLLLVADESEMSMPDSGWLTLVEREELRRITVDTSELKELYDIETRRHVKEAIGGCTLFGSKVLLLKTPREVDAKILELARVYRSAREGAYI